VPGVIEMVHVRAHQAARLERHDVRTFKRVPAAVRHRRSRPLLRRQRKSLDCPCLE
jgi:hypothetical protein